MRYRRVGDSGLQVSVVGLGTNNFGRRIDEAASIRVLHAALDRGINFIDTADVYGSGASEEFIGRGLKDRRAEAIIATKFGMSMGEGPYRTGGSRLYIRKAVEDSLRRLKTDYIDLYQMHRYDPDTPLDETLATPTSPAGRLPMPAGSLARIPGRPSSRRRIAIHCLIALSSAT